MTSRRIDLRFSSEHAEQPLEQIEALVEQLKARVRRQLVDLLLRLPEPAPERVARVQRGHDVVARHDADLLLQLVRVPRADGDARGRRVDVDEAADLVQPPADERLVRDVDPCDASARCTQSV